jgi:dTDP-glucose 4,6-dehydratase
MNRETFLVIGSNSFSGSNFINFLLNQNMKVIGISRRNEKKTLNPYKYNKNVKHFKFFKLLINIPVL